MASTMKQSLVATPVVAQVRVRATAAPMRVICQAEQTSRRAALGAIFGAGAALIASSAEAKVVVQSQFSTGGIGKSTGKAANSSVASMGAYDMEGIKKQGITPKRKAKVLEAAKKEAAKKAAIK